MIDIRPAQVADLPAIDALLDTGFGPARRNRTAYRLRDGAAPLAGLSLVARDGAALVGSVQCWPIALRTPRGAGAPLTLLGPLVTAPAWQGQGIGAALMAAALAAADRADAPPLLLIGDASYYGRFGFSAAATGGWRLPGPVDPARLLLRGGGLPAVGWIEPGAGLRRAA